MVFAFLVFVTLNVGVINSKYKYCVMNRKSVGS